MSTSALRDAMKNADEMLLLVAKDQSSISQTLKMVEEEESPSSLRWYVYPKVRRIENALDIKEICTQSRFETRYKISSNPLF